MSVASPMVELDLKYGVGPSVISPMNHRNRGKEHGVRGKEVTVEDRFRNPMAIKAMMNVLGMPAGPGRRPLGKLTPQAALKLKEALDATLRDAPEVLEPVASFYKVDLRKRIADDSLWAGLVY